MAFQLWRSDYTKQTRKGTTLAELEQLFKEYITTKFIYEPIYFRSEHDDALEVKTDLHNRDFDYVGIADSDNEITGYCGRNEIEEGILQNYKRNFERHLVIAESTPLSELFRILLNTPYAFVLAGNKIVGIVTIWDINKPIVRIYLFGIISMFELHLNFWINDLYPESAWSEHLPEKRVKQAVLTMQQRIGNNDALTLLECLQISDKKEILLSSAKFLEDFEFSKNGFNNMLYRAESIRNELAHSQHSIIANQSWDQFVNTITGVETFIKKSELKSAELKN